MEYRFLGDTGVKVSSLCMGTMTFGREADKKNSKKIFKQCRDVGINFFDSADIYAKGESEKILGELIADCRDEVIITSKVYFPTGSDPNARGSSRRHIMKSVEASLRRLKTHYIDLYFLHRFDDYTSIEETLRVLDDLVSQGKIMYIGASNFSAWQTVKALGISEKNGWNSFKCIQPMYNLIKRQAEVEILPMAQSENLGVIPYSPLAGGLLTGKYELKQKPDSGRFLNNEMYQSRYSEEWLNEVAHRFVSFSKEQGFNPVSLAVAWIADHPGVTAPIIGARNLEQLEDSLNSVKIDMTSDLYSKISELSPIPPPATDRMEELVSDKFHQR